jgi:dihydroorotate dehydrogenase (fumarate)
MIQIEMNIDGISFSHPIINASGCWSMNESQIQKLSNSQLAGIVSKTCTLDPRLGNPSPNYYHDKENQIKINSKGLPNLGYEYYKNLIHKLVIDKPYILSISTHHLEEILIDYDKFLSQKKSMVEINMSCPNIENRIPGYHCKDILHVIQKIESLHLTNVVCGIKLPPLFEIEKIQKISKLFNQNKQIKFIVCSNTIPNGLEPRLMLTGGISSKINKYISLSNIRSFKKYLSPDIHLIGCGGIENEKDVLDYLNIGASLVQVGSAFYNEETNELDIDKINRLLDIIY